MLIEEYDLEVLTPPCKPGDERYLAKAHLRVDISGVLPLLNRTLSDATFMPAAKALTWKKGDHKVAFHALEIDVSNIESREGAEHEIEDLIGLVNRTWDQREEITPSFEVVQRLSPMQVYQRLPQTNCGLCGESTCFNFALKLASAQAKLRACPPIHEPENAENLEILQAGIAASGSGTP